MYLLILQLYNYAEYGNQDADFDIFFGITGLTGQTGFHSACEQKHDELVDWMISSKGRWEKFGIRLESLDNEGRTGYDLWPEKFKEKSFSTSMSPSRKMQKMSQT